MNYLLRLCSQTGYLLSLVVLFNFILLGVLASYLNIPQLYWLGALSPVLLLTSVAARSSVLSVDVFPLWLWLAYLVCSWLFWTDGVQLKMVAIKDYLIPTVSLFMVSRLRLSEIQLEGFYKLLRLVVFCQPVFLLHQFFVLARNSDKRMFDWDMIVGTFGFNPDGGGGNSAGLLLFVCFFLVVAVSRVRSGIVQRLDYLAMALCLMSIFMMEAKVVIVLAFFVLISISRKEDWFNPALVGRVALFLVVLGGALLVSYNANFSTGDKAGRGLDEYLIEMQEGYFNEDVISYETGEVSRQASIDIWLESNFSSGVTESTAFGYGLTSSKYSNSREVEAISYASFINFASTQVSTYLWDVGFFSLFFIALIFFVRLKVLVGGGGGLNVVAFRRGFCFLILSAFLYFFYSNTLHVNAISFFLIALAFIKLDGRNGISREE